MGARTWLSELLPLGALDFRAGVQRPELRGCCRAKESAPLPHIGGWRGLCSSKREGWWGSGAGVPSSACWCQQFQAGGFLGATPQARPPAACGHQNKTPAGSPLHPPGSLWALSSTPPAAAAAAAKSLQSCPTLCDPIDSSPPTPAQIRGVG